MFAIDRANSAFDTYTYKKPFDSALRTGNWSFLRHHVMEFRDQCPAIACSQLFSVDSVRFGSGVLRVILNILPVSSERTIVIISATEKEFELATDHVSPSLDGDEYLRKYEISKIVIRNSENFFINPRHFARWSESKKRTIIDYFQQTMQDGIDQDSPDFYLF